MVPCAATVVVVAVLNDVRPCVNARPCEPVSGLLRFVGGAASACLGPCISLRSQTESVGLWMPGGGTGSLPFRSVVNCSASVVATSFRVTGSPCGTTACEFPGLELGVPGIDRLGARLPPGFGVGFSPRPLVLPVDAFTTLSGAGAAGRAPLDDEDELPSLDPTSDPAAAEDCELWRRGIAGRRLEPVDATKAPVFFLGTIAGDFLRSSLAVGIPGTFASGPFGGAACPSPGDDSSSSDSGGETKRAVGRGPDVEGPLGFFRIGCEGGGLLDEGWYGFATSIPIASASPLVSGGSASCALETAAG